MFLYEAHCVLCLNVNGARVPATTMLAAYLVCDTHGQLNLWRTNSDGTLNLYATVDYLKHQERIREQHLHGGPT